jgi:ElaA protein
MPIIEWTSKSFEQLSGIELYAILRLRSEVFVVEQNCVYLDLDNKDQSSFHICGHSKNELVAYARILPPGLAFIEASIGRVSTSPAYRHHGAGRELMIRSIAFTQQQFNDRPIRIGAQLYLEKFYSSLGFQSCSPVYLEDGIPHIEMILVK